MPFIGTTPAQGFASSVNKQSFTANGSTTSFTLAHPVSNANDLEVFVGNVRQEPTAAYTASGTTLDFGSGNAPPNGVNLYVVYKGLAQVTTTPPDGSVGTGKIAANAVTVGKLATSGALPALDGSALTGTMTKVFHSAWTSDVAQVLANNVVTTTHLHYKIFLRVQPDANSVVTIRMTTGGNSPADAVNVAVYQGNTMTRAAASSYLSYSLNGSNDYAVYPSNNNIYANANSYGVFEIMNVRSGAVSGSTNINPARSRGFNFHHSEQNVSSADHHFGSGAGYFWNATSSDNPTVTGFKFAPYTGNWAQGEITIYGFGV